MKEKNLVTILGCFTYIFIKNLCCRYSLEAPQRGASNEYPQPTLSWRTGENDPRIFIKYPSLTRSLQLPISFFCLCCYFVPKRTAHAHISLCIRAVWSRPSLSANRIIGYYGLCVWMKRKSSGDTLRMRRIIWICAFWACPKNNTSTCYNKREKSG